MIEAEKKAQDERNQKRYDEMQQEMADQKTAEQEQHVADYNAAKDYFAAKGMTQGADFKGIGSRMMEAHQKEVADAQEQVDYEETVATQLTGLGFDTAAGDVTNQAEFFAALGLSDQPSYEEVSAALGEDPDYTPSLPEDVIKAQEIETARIGRMDLASTLAGARGAAGPRDLWEDDPDVMAAQSAFDIATEEYHGLQGLAGGGKVGNQEMALVGESGPEVALFPNGTEIIPLDRNVQPAQARRLRQRGIRGMAEGGVVFPTAGEIETSRYGGAFPSGVRRTIAGQRIAPSAGRLFRAAGLGVPSGQGLRNMLPEDLEIYQDIGAQAGIPEGSFQRELALGIPSGERQRGSARFLPLSLRS
jgi:hypothetical protein